MKMHINNGKEKIVMILKEKQTKIIITHKYNYIKIKQMSFLFVRFSGSKHSIEIPVRKYRYKEAKCICGNGMIIVQRIVFQICSSNVECFACVRVSTV